MLKMNWLYTYGVKMDCDDPKVITRDEQGRELCFMVKERGKKNPCPLKFVTKTSELLWEAYVVYWCYAINIHDQRLFQPKEDSY